MEIQALRFLDDAGNPKETYREWSAEEIQQSFEHVAKLAALALESRPWEQIQEWPQEGLQGDDLTYQFLSAISQTADAPTM